nr:Uncharacterised protein [Providencia rettgeri]
MMINNVLVIIAENNQRAVSTIKIPNKTAYTLTDMRAG